MENNKYNLAQINIARMLAPIDDPLMSDFAAQLDEINLLAEQSPGYVWRLEGEYGDATDIEVYNDPLILINMSVWESVEALYDYTYRSAHAKVYRDRRDWFEKPDKPTYTLWWIPAGELPSVEQGKERLEHMHQHGETQYAFSFKMKFAAPVE